MTKLNRYAVLREEYADNWINDNKYYDLASMQAEVPTSIRAHYEALEHRADECLGCKDCEDRCPFGVKIAERMEKAAKFFQRSV